MNRDRKKEIILKTYQNSYADNAEDLADEIASSLQIMEDAEAIANIQSPDLSEYRIMMSKSHLARTKAALEMVQLDHEVEFKIDTIKVYIPYKDKVADILRHAIAELEKAIRNEENDWWE